MQAFKASKHHKIYKLQDTVAFLTSEISIIFFETGRTKDTFIESYLSSHLTRSTFHLKFYGLLLLEPPK